MLVKEKSSTGLKKKIFIGLGVVLLVSTIGFATIKASQGSEKPAKPVQTVKVTEENLEARIITTGKVQSKVIRQVASDTSGKVLNVMVKAGDVVAPGQPLCVLDGGDLDSQIKQKQLQIQIEQEKSDQASKDKSTTKLSAYELAKKNEEVVRKDYEARKALYESGASSESELRDYEYKYKQALDALTVAKANYESSENIRSSYLQIQMLQAELEKLQNDKKKLTVSAPVAGTVTVVSVKPLDIVASNGMLFTLEDLSQLEAVTNVSEFDVSKIHLGQEVTFKPSGLKGSKFNGKVSYIAPAAVVQTNGQTRQTSVEVRMDILDPTKDLKSNFSTEVNIKTESKKNALVVPYEALYTSPEGVKKIFVVEGETLKEKPVKIGIEGDLSLEVSFDGIKKGLEVVMNPNEEMKEGERVKAMASASSKAGETP